MSTCVPISVVIAAQTRRKFSAVASTHCSRRPDPTSLRSWSCATAARIGRQKSLGSTATGVRVIETPKPSKTAAFNLGDAVSPAFRGSTSTRTSPFHSNRSGGSPRVSTRKCPGGVAGHGPLISRVQLRGSGVLPGLADLPYVREGMIGVGVYALSEKGPERFAEFPDVIADDGYVRMLFG